MSFRLMFVPSLRIWMWLRIARSDWMSFRLMIVKVLFGAGSVRSEIAPLIVFVPCSADRSEIAHDELKSHELMSLRNWMCLRCSRIGLSLMSLTI